MHRLKLSFFFLPTIAGVLATACLKSKPSNRGVPGFAQPTV